MMYFEFNIILSVLFLAWENNLDSIIVILLLLINNFGVVVVGGGGVWMWLYYMSDR